ncbi:hypothetical protein RBQ61_02745 [Sedimentibacter sp. MB35-C1]|uniref:hypothetical protein n=1 Tax=Sedimentibacter sp. MB35-C1 TaxID=3070995 RepID=UPI0027DF24B6|nr:hypothetical protein [Sedimentibacter sp. MB35-C1]WMJ77863.1 hypothetical protein RBQ61_02745 [Sedimentibacter sp. MB35-C1]
MKQTDKDLHDLLIEMINEVEKDMEIYEIRKKTFKKRNKLLRPSMAFRSGDLLSYMYQKCNEERKRLQAMHIIEECFYKCTLTALYYINLDDLRTLIKFHKEKKIWRIRIEKTSNMC